MSDRVIDPVCGMNVRPENASSAELDGTTYHFCSEGCRDAFVAEPGRFLQVAEHAAHGGHHGHHEHAGH